MRARWGWNLHAQHCIFKVLTAAAAAAEPDMSNISAAIIKRGQARLDSQDQLGQVPLATKATVTKQAAPISAYLGSKVIVS